VGFGEETANAVQLLEGAGHLQRLAGFLVISPHLPDVFKEGALIKQHLHADVKGQGEQLAPHHRKIVLQVGEKLVKGAGGRWVHLVQMAQQAGPQVS